MKSDDLSELLEICKKAFVKEFGLPPTVAVKAPGRVNIIGDHTDYNEGFVFPMAIPRYTVIVGRPNGTEKIQILTLAEEVEDPKRVEFDVPSENNRLTPGNPKWLNYIKGVVEHFPYKIPGFDACILCTVPIGAGLSSSASLEVATCTLLEALIKQSLPLADKALLCQKAEHTFAFMPCGIMDQFISCMGKEDKALLIDCRSLETTLVPLKNSLEMIGNNQIEDVTFLVINSNVKHKLTGSEYPERRNDCFEAAKILGLKTLREATMAGLRENREKMGDRVYLRALHVVTETERCVKASEAITNGDFVLLGQLMYQSHISLRDLHGVSCVEIDNLVDITMQIPGVYGSRITGGGFGGCVVALIKSSEAENIISEIKKQYNNGICYIFKAADGAGEISL